MAKRKGKSPSKIITEYRKVRAAAGARIRAQQKQGYFGVELPTIPKKITKASIRNLQKFTTKYIREKSTIFVSPSSGELVTAYDVRVEAAQRRSEAGKKAYETRIQRQEQNYRSFAETFSEKHLPTKQNIILNNFMNDIISKITPSDFFRELKTYVYQERSSALFYVKSNTFKTVINNNTDLIIAKINQIISRNEVDKVYRSIVNSSLKDELFENIHTALYYDKESDIDNMNESRTRVLEILNSGVLTQEDYNNLRDESDDEA